MQNKSSSRLLYRFRILSWCLLGACGGTDWPCRVRHPRSTRSSHDDKNNKCWSSVLDDAPRYPQKNPGRAFLPAFERVPDLPLPENTTVGHLSACDNAASVQHGGT